MELRRKGASLGQIIAFFIASPWNSISLALIMIALIAWEWTLSFIALSMVIALIAGWLFDRFEQNGTLPANPVTSELPDDFKWALGYQLKPSKYQPAQALRPESHQLF